MKLPTNEALIAFLNNLFNTNSEFALNHNQDFFSAFESVQSPKLTIVKCSDSRVQMESFDKTPQNEVFAIRNIGNQIKTCQGSVDFGVQVLNTPFLLIIGHSDCGAVTAVVNNTVIESDAIKCELANIHVQSKCIKTAILENVHNQVAIAVEKYQERINAQQLTVLGAVYDFKNDFGFGNGKLVMININGSKDANVLDQTYAQLVKKFKVLKSYQ
jgi:carbonic anhydrase